MRRNNRLLRNKVRMLEQNITRLEERGEEDAESDTTESEPNLIQAHNVSDRDDEGLPRVRTRPEGVPEPPGIISTIPRWLEQLGFVNKWTDESVRMFVEGHTNQVKEVIRSMHRNETAQQQQRFDEQLAFERENAKHRFEAAQEIHQKPRGVPAPPTTGSPTTPVDVQTKKGSAKQVQPVDVQQFANEIRDRPTKKKKLKRLLEDEKDRGITAATVEVTWRNEEIHRLMRKDRSAEEVEAEIRDSEKRLKDAETQVKILPIHEDLQETREKKYEIIRCESIRQRMLRRLIDYKKSEDTSESEESDTDEIEAVGDLNAEEPQKREEYEDNTDNHEAKADKENNESDITAEQEEEMLRAINCQTRISNTYIEIAQSQGATFPGGHDMFDCEPIIRMLQAHRVFHDEFQALHQNVLKALQVLGEEAPNLPPTQLVSAYIVESVELIRTAEAGVRDASKVYAAIIDFKNKTDALHATEPAWTASSSARRFELYNDIRREIREYTETLAQIDPDYRPPGPGVNSWYHQHEDPKDFDNDQEFVECFTIGEIQRLQNHKHSLRQQIHMHPDAERQLLAKWAAVNTRVNTELEGASQLMPPPHLPPSQLIPSTSQSMPPTLPPKLDSGMRPVPDSTQTFSQRSASFYEPINPSLSPKTFDYQLIEKHGEMPTGGNQNDLTSEPAIVPSNPNDYDVDDEL